LIRNATGAAGAVARRVARSVWSSPRGPQIADASRRIFDQPKPHDGATGVAMAKSLNATPFPRKRPLWMLPDAANIHFKLTLMGESVRSRNRQHSVVSSVSVKKANGTREEIRTADFQIRRIVGDGCVMPLGECPELALLRLSNATENVCQLGKTGSERRAIKVTRMTQLGREPSKAPPQIDQ
jgi:hypothetical protein